MSRNGFSEVSTLRSIGYWASDFWKQQDRFSKGRARLMSWLRSVLLDFPQYRDLFATRTHRPSFSQKRVREGFTVWASDLELAPLFPELGEVKAT